MTAPTSYKVKVGGVLVDARVWRRSGGVLVPVWTPGTPGVPPTGDIYSLRNGHAAAVTGGQGGATYEVTQTSGSGAGTLVDALTGTTAREITYAAGLAGQTIDIGGMVDVGRNKTLDWRGSGITIRGGFNNGYYNTVQNPSGVGFQPEDVGNVIIAGVRIETGVGGGADAVRLSANADLVWVHRCTFTNTSDGLVDATNALTSDMRVTVDWCHFGPHPGVENYAEWIADGRPGGTFAEAGDNTYKLDGKAMLFSQAPGGQTILPANALRIKATIHHNVFKHTRQRNGKFRGALTHFYNNAVVETSTAPTPKKTSMVEVSDYTEFDGHDNVFRDYVNGDHHYTSAGYTGYDAEYGPDPFDSANVTVTTAEHIAVDVLDHLSDAGTGRATRCRVVGSFNPNGETVDQWRVDEVTAPAYEYTVDTADQAFLDTLEANAGAPAQGGS